MNKLNIQGFGQAGIVFPDINVNIILRNPKTGEVIKEYKKHNRVCRVPLYTILRMINGEFSQCDDDTVKTNKYFQLYNYIPRYIAFGSGTKEIDINDTGLENEITHTNSETGKAELARMKITRAKSFENQYNAPYIKLIIKHTVPMDQFVKDTIGEVGLFCEEEGDNLWARIVIDPFIKDDTTVIDITWTISVVIIETEEEPFDMVDKTDLKLAIRNSLDKAGILQSKYQSLCQLLSEANDIYASKTSTQTRIDEITVELQEAINALNETTT